MTIAIKVENLSKMYFLHHKSPQRYTALRDVLVEKTLNIFNVISNKTNSKKNEFNKKEEFWALHDANLEIQQGERVGIIGRNGAGKSTFLKILSRITEPTSGRIVMKGRVSSLLEVGTGFHPELTGRENIFLNGAILGMSNREIKRKFDEIVEFAEIDKFLDTPVKRYSSGMYVRLAFAVAAHLEPEILIVDEVLAVGDAQFQNKCLGKMREVGKEGRTVLFVSHNMAAIQALCDYGVLINKGIMGKKISANDAISQYISSSDSQSNAKFPIHNAGVTLHSFKVMQNGSALSDYDSGSAIQITIIFELASKLTDFRVGFIIKNALGEILTRCLLADWDASMSTLNSGKYEISISIPKNYFTSNNFIFEPHVSQFGIIDYKFEEKVSYLINIIEPSNFNPSHRGERTFGSILLPNNWQFNKS
jgi:lipopolysaccharide transport system ATP-binding protein